MLSLSTLRHVPTVLRRVARTALLSAAIALAATSAQAVTVFVDGPNPAASDLNIGTELQPFLTINGAMVRNICTERMSLLAREISCPDWTRS